MRAAVQSCKAWWLALVVGMASFPAVAGTASIPNRQAEILGNRPLTFEANLGQHSPGVAFVARGAAYSLALSPTEVRVQLRKKIWPAEDLNTPLAGVRHEPTTVKYANLKIELLGASPEATINGQGATVGRINYFIGNDPAQWRAGVPAFERVRVTDVYPGINLLHYGNQKQLEYDFEVAPGANPSVIALRFTGADRMELSTAGDLILHLGEERIQQPKPIIYQTIAGRRIEVFGGYQLVNADTVKFSLGNYDVSVPLIIDPVISYAAYFDAPGDDRLWAVAIGPQGDLFLAGETLSTSDFATSGAFQTNFAGALAGHGDAFVSRHKNNDSQTDVYVTYLGGIAHDVAFALAVDDDGNAYVTGYTASTNFPTRFAVQTNIAGPAVPGFTIPPVDCFIAKIGPQGTNVIFSTFYGGSGGGFNGEGNDIGRGIALDAARNVYVAGQTFSTNFPTKNTALTNKSGFEDAFLVKLDAAGTNVIYAAYLGGAGRDYAFDVAVDAGGNPIVIGSTASTNFPVTTNAFQLYLNQSTNITSADDAFLVSFLSTTGAVAYATFLGGTNNDRAARVATDSAGAAYITGWTQSGSFPRTTTNLPVVVVSNTTYADVFVTKLTPGNTNLDYSLVFGGDGQDQGWDIGVDTQGHAHITGETASLNFPTNAYGASLSGTNAGGIDAFLAEINSTGTGLVYSGYLGGPYTDRGYGVAVDAAGNSYFTGETIFGTLPFFLYAGATDLDGFIIKMVVETALTITNTGTNVAVSWPGYSPELALQSSTNLLATNAWVTVTNAPVFTNGFHVVTLSATNTPGFFRLIKP